MDLALFQYVDDVLALYKQKRNLYVEIKEHLEDFFEQVDLGDGVVSYPSRLKSEESLKEKLIRQEFFSKFESSQEALSQVSDLVGLTIQVRFIRHEVSVFENLFHLFLPCDNGLYQAKDCGNIYLNLDTAQPQSQKNGCPIYRIDGYYRLQDEMVRFEIQIKAMVHQFWSDIEHEVIYKNSDYIVHDQFNRNMLAAIRDNLEVMDHQLELIYSEIFHGKVSSLGLDELHFKLFLAKSLNELVKKNMEKGLGFSTDFQKPSSTIAQMIFIQEFIQREQKEFLMLDYLERLDELKQSDIDFKKAFLLKEPKNLEDGFLVEMVPYLFKEMNVNFRWHVFFRMVFAIQKEESTACFVETIRMIERLLLQDQWLKEKLISVYGETAEEINQSIRHSLGKAMCEIDDIRCYYEENLLKISRIFQDILEMMIQEKRDLLWFDRQLRKEIAQQI
ncbi:MULTISPECIES: hypothetical protein [Terrabacteria group]|uniref:hypothetical protein n=1 Tax=Bacillati TaxID=1783272 RepID=UPI001C6EC622|nr:MULTISPECIES: hypothetical protein [Terrabacteria group]MBW9211870.1 hypothetical protein [Trueperella sp. zg.1013]